MKNILLFLTLVSTALSCTKDNDEPKNNIPAELVGKWKVTHQYSASGSGLDGTWVELDTGKIYDIWLKNDGIFVTPDDENCEVCNYYISDNKLYLSTNGGDSPGTIKDLTEQTFILWWDDFEGSGYKYKKIEG